MKITKIEAENIGPIKRFAIENMGSIVMIAGANGSGKTKIKEAIAQTFMVHGNTNTFAMSQHVNTSLNITILPETEFENEIFGGRLDVLKGVKSDKLFKHMTSSIHGSLFESIVIDINTNRNTNKTKETALLSGAIDPEDRPTNKNIFLSSFDMQWDQIITSIYDKCISVDRKISRHVRSPENQQETNEQTNLKFKNPFIKYQTAFEKLLPGKVLEDINLDKKSEFKYKIQDVEGSFSFSQLSSGEQEVIKIIFLLIHRDIRNSIFLIDEPELHLHQNLAANLIDIITSLGDGTNQFIFFTHSSDLISKYCLTGDVYFINKENLNENQAVKLSEILESRPELMRIIGKNLGLFALGKNLLFIEGNDDSLDVKCYKKISENILSDCIIVPSESCLNLMSLEKLTNEIRNKIFGVNLYMIRDRDGLLQDKINLIESGQTLKCLKKRHLENYFLNPVVLSKVAIQLCLEDKYRDPKNINEALEKIRDKNFKVAFDVLMKDYFNENFKLQSPKVKEIDKYDEDQLLAQYINDAENRIEIINTDLVRFSSELNDLKCKLKNSMNDETWKDIFPGKRIFQALCSVMKGDSRSIAEAYIDIALKEHQHVFHDIIQIFQEFKT